MDVIFEGPVWLSYGQMYLAGPDDETGYTEAFEGQRNGLLGAGLPGSLTMTTALHTGTVALRVVLAGSEPAVPAQWPDVVEASFRPRSEELFITGCTAESAGELRLPVRDYRARYCLGDPVDDDAADLERCELVLWPAPASPDAIIRVGGEHARYAHDALDPEAVRRDLEKAWNGDVTSERVRQHAAELARSDRAFTDTLDASTAQVQRALAYWTVGTACREAGIDRIDWVAEILRSLPMHRALPPWFRPDVVYDRLAEDPHHRTNRDDGSGGQALFLVFGAVDHDAFGAAAGNVTHLLASARPGRAPGLMRAVGAELDRLRNEPGAHDQDGRDPRPPDACGFSEPEPDEYLGSDAVDRGRHGTGVVTLELLAPGDFEDGWSSEAAAAPHLPSPSFPASPTPGARERDYVDQEQALDHLAAGTAQTLYGVRGDRYKPVLLERVRQLCALAGVDGYDWVGAAVRCCELDRRLPEPFASRTWEEVLAGSGHESRWVLVEGERHDQGVLALEALARWSAFRAWSSSSEAALTVLHALVFAVEDAGRREYLRAILDDLERRG